MAEQSDSKAWIHLHPADHCVVALRKLNKGESVDLPGKASVLVKKDIPPGHKMAIDSRPSGAPVHKYGWSIGVATVDIAPGDHLHDHNLKCHHTLDYEGLASETPPAPSRLTGRTFQGYVRPSGRDGTRNYIHLPTTGNCSDGESNGVGGPFAHGDCDAFKKAHSGVPMIHTLG